MIKGFVSASLTNGPGSGSRRPKIRNTSYVLYSTLLHLPPLRYHHRSGPWRFPLFFIVVLFRSTIPFPPHRSRSLSVNLHGSLSLHSYSFFPLCVACLSLYEKGEGPKRQRSTVGLLQIHSRAFAEFEWALKLTNQLHYYISSHPPRIDTVSLKSEKVCTVQCTVQQWNSAWYC